MAKVGTRFLANSTIALLWAKHRFGYKPLGVKAVK